MDPINFDFIKTTVVRNSEIIAQNTRQLAYWCGHMVCVGYNKAIPAIQFLWNQSQLIVKELFNLATTAIGTTALFSVGLFAVGVGASRVANRLEYQDADQRAIRAFWRTIAAFAYVGATVTAGTAIALVFGIV